jgi:hypothetical protein
MRRALCVGINDYPAYPLTGCVNDAIAIGNLLQRHEDGSPNFHVKPLVDTLQKITKAELIEQTRQLFGHKADVALFYFSGHGVNVNNLGGYLVMPDSVPNDEGVHMYEILNLVNTSLVHEIVIILDCCDSAAFGKNPSDKEEKIMLREGVSILTASGSREAAIEKNSRGKFTQLICEVNAASIYSYCDQILGAWDQRPRFMANVSELTELRLCKPHVEKEILRLIVEYFPDPMYEYPLDPSYESDKRNLPEPHIFDKKHEEIFRHLQKYNRARLLIPIDEEHMYDAAAKSKPCKLTPLGQLYWRLAKNGKL